MYATGHPSRRCWRTELTCVVETAWLERMRALRMHERPPVRERRAGAGRALQIWSYLSVSVMYRSLPCAFW